MRASRTRYILLGVLTLGPKSGYDIKKFIEQSVGYFWSESFGQIYPTLRQLDAEGLVKHRVEGKAGRPDRYVYTLTARGRAELRDWLTQPAEPEVPRHELLLKLFFGTQVSAQANLAHVIRYRREIERYVAMLKEGDRKLRKKYGDSEQGTYWLLTVAQGVLVNEALLQWCKRAERELRKLEKRGAGSVERRVSG
jgi:PadR family transcriptional regulator AphA